MYRLHPIPTSTASALLPKNHHYVHLSPFHFPHQPASSSLQPIKRISQYGRAQEAQSVHSAYCHGEERQTKWERGTFRDKKSPSEENKRHPNQWFTCCNPQCWRHHFPGRFRRRNWDERWLENKSQGACSCKHIWCCSIHLSKSINPWL